MSVVQDTIVSCGELLYQCLLFVDTADSGRCKRSNKKHKTWEGDGEYMYVLIT